jgi:hypothetical protein
LLNVATRFTRQTIKIFRYRWFNLLSMDRSRCSRRTLLTATGSGLIAGCLGQDGAETPAPQTDDSTETATPARTPTPTDGDAPAAISGTEGGEREVSVADFGAEPDVEEDQTEAIRDAFRAAATEGATVTFPAGTYHLDTNGPLNHYNGDIPLDTYFLRLRGYEGLTVEGNGATLSLAGRVVDGTRHFARTLGIGPLTDATVRNLTVDWDRDIPHTGGTVIEDTPDYFDMEVGDPYTPREGLFAVSYIPYDPERNRVSGGLRLQHRQGARCEKRSDSVLRVQKTEQYSDRELDVGQSVMVRHGSAGGVALNANECDNLLVQNVEILSTPGMGVVVHGGTGVTLENVSVRPPENRWNSATRDGFHISSVRGELILRNVTASHTGDDAFNLKSDRRPVTTVVDRSTIEISYLAITWGDSLYPPYRVGDELELGASPEPVVPDITRTIDRLETSAEPTDDLAVVRLTNRIGLDEPLSESVANAETISVLDTSATPDRVLLADSVAKKLRGGCRFQLDHTEIRDCVFNQTNGNPMLLMVMTVEGEPANDLTVRGNRFIDTAYRGGGGGMITTFLNMQSETPPNDLWANHTYEDNVFENISRPDFPAINLNDTSDVTIDNNDFSGLPDDVDPINYGDNVDCESISVNGKPGCLQPE